MFKVCVHVWCLFIFFHIHVISLECLMFSNFPSVKTWHLFGWKLRSQVLENFSRALMSFCSRMESSRLVIVFISFVSSEKKGTILHGRLRGDHWYTLKRVDQKRCLVVHHSILSFFLIFLRVLLPTGAGLLGTILPRVILHFWHHILLAFLKVFNGEQYQSLGKIF